MRGSSKKVVLIGLVLLLVAVAVIGIIFYPAGQKSRDPLTYEIAAYLPENPLIAVLTDTEAPAYKRLRNDPKWASYGNSGTFQGILELVQDSASLDANAIMEPFKKAGLIGEEDLSTQMLFFLSSNTATPSMGSLDFGLFQFAKPGLNFSDKVTALKTLLSKEDYKIENIDSTIFNGFSVNLDLPADKKLPEARFSKLIFAAKPDRMAVSNSIETINTFFEDKPSAAGIRQIKEAEDFKRLYGQAQSNDSFLFGYMDVISLLKLASDDTRLTEIEGKEVSLMEIPATKALFTRSFNASIRDSFRIGLEPKTELQKTMLTSLSKISSPIQGTRLVPPGVMNLGLNGRLVSVLKNITLSELGEEVTKELSERMEALDHVNEVVISVSKVENSASPIPELSLVISADNAQSAYQSLFDEIVASLEASGMRGMEWRDKKVGDFNFKYATSMLGVGLYMGQAGDRIYLASSEAGMMSAYLAPDSQREKSLHSALPGNIKDAADAHPNSLMWGYVNFRSLTNMLRDLSVYSATLTGGQDILSEERLSLLSQVGQGLSLISLTENSVHIDAAYGPLGD